MKTTFIIFAITIGTMCLGAFYIYAYNKGYAAREKERQDEIKGLEDWMDWNFKRRKSGHNK